MADTPRRYIVYACPLGELADQLDRYYAASRAQFGPNTAHQYPPHCTLTGFFHDLPQALHGYIAALNDAHQHVSAAGSGAFMQVCGLELRPDFHGLLLVGAQSQALAAAFAERATSPTRAEPVRLKDWLHLSLAYGFPPEQHAGLARLARDLVDPTAIVLWELRFYERHAHGGWTCHARWPLW